MYELNIITHRSLEPSNPNFWSESAIEGFHDHLVRGFGIEFDPNITIDGIVVAHDKSLGRITKGDDKRLFREITTAEALAVPLERGRLGNLDELLSAMRKSSAIHAMHIKYPFQNPADLDKLLAVIEPYADVMERTVLFDVKIETAEYLRQRNPRLILAPSVAHPYDIQRYNGAVGETLYTLQEVIKHRALFDWVWLDEWDLAGEHGKQKTFYNSATFEMCRAHGFKIGLVTPELHGTSPGLLGGEAHEDAKPLDKLLRRIQAIIDLKPDAICTDYPDEARRLLS